MPSIPREVELFTRSNEDICIIISKEEVGNRPNEQSVG